MEIKWSDPGKDEITLSLEIRNNEILGASYQCSGSLSFIEFAKEQTALLSGSPQKLELPKGGSPKEIIWREILQKIKGEWEYPIKHEEVCHCRRVSAKTIDSAIIYGAHSPEMIRKRTSANTGCGTCLPDIESLLKLRL